MQSVPSAAGLTRAIASVCTRHPVALCYVFGSHARGTADAESDIDVAVLADPNLSPLERRDLRFRLMRELADALGVFIERLDVVILQDVPTLLQFNVIRTGRSVFGDPTTRRTFELTTEQHYDDEAPYLDREAAITLDRILAHRP